jgi:hypothetical protein
MGILQNFPLSLEFGITTFEAGLAGAQDLELPAEGDVIYLLPLLQLPLQLIHLPRPLVDLMCTHDEVLLLLDDGVNPSLGRCV